MIGHYAIRFLLALYVLALAGCRLGTQGSWLRGTQPLVKIGLAAPFEGLGRPLGYDALTGVKLAIAERNAVGGVEGYLVELVALNDFGEPDEARLQAREFGADPAVLGVITGWSNATARAALPEYRKAGLAVIVPWSVDFDLADSPSGIVLVAADTQQVAESLADAAAAAEPDRFVVVGNGRTATYYADALAARGIHAEKALPPSSKDRKSLDVWVKGLISTQARGADTLLLSMDGVSAGEILLALSDLDWTGSTFAGVDAGSVHVVSVGEEAANHLTFASPAPAGKDLKGTTVVRPIPGQQVLGPRAILAYDAAQVLLDALEIAVRQDGYPSRRGVIAALPRVSRNGLTGAIDFDSSGGRVGAPVWLYNIVHSSYPGELLGSPEATSGN